MFIWQLSQGHASEAEGWEEDEFPELFPQLFMFIYQLPLPTRTYAIQEVQEIDWVLF